MFVDPVEAMERFPNVPLDDIALRVRAIEGWAAGFTMNRKIRYLAKHTDSVVPEQWPAELRAGLLDILAWQLTNIEGSGNAAGISGGGEGGLKKKVVGRVTFEYYSGASGSASSEEIDNVTGYPKKLVYFLKPWKSAFWAGTDAWSNV